MSRATRTERGASARLQRGFTLLEILVALVIFAIASVIAYGGLNTIISIKGSLDREIRFWRELGQVFERIEMDVVQTSPQLFRADTGGLLPPLQGGPANDNAGFTLALSRYDQDRAPVHVTYRCDDQRLTLSLAAIDANTRRADSSAASAASAVPVHVLLQDVEQCELAFLAANNAWLSAWPGSETTLKPRAIRVRLTLTGRGQFERLFYLP